MKLIKLPEPPAGYPTRLEREGLVYNRSFTKDGEPFSYFDYEHHLQFGDGELKVLGDAAARLFQAMIVAGDFIIYHNLFERMGIPSWAIPAIKKTWNDDAANPSVYARFDLCPVTDTFGRIVGAKLLEFNADTPTSLVETAVTQWNWFIDAFPEQASLPREQRTIDQWNYLDECLIRRWMREIANLRATGKDVDLVHFAYTTADKSGEDKFTAAHMQWLADQAAKRMGGLDKPAFRTELITMEQIVALCNMKHQTEAVYRVLKVQDGKPDLEQMAEPGEEIESIEAFYVYDYEKKEVGSQITTIWKLYPWEFMLEQESGLGAVQNIMTEDGVTWIEPIYKMLWSNKAILPILWKIFGDPDQVHAKLASAKINPVHYDGLGDPGTIRDLLLPAYFGDDDRRFLLESWVVKPLLGREGADIKMKMFGRDFAAGEKQGYEMAGAIWQELQLLPTVKREGEDFYVVAGVWIVPTEGGDGLPPMDAVAACFRYDTSPVTGNLSRLVSQTTLIGE